ncbi:hypothetical protein GH714_030646 [Hevea brasiliensis]|uniref:Uncharacterized protein n=1 Tax=Hevea brasiliensis TaxID=3981 RepID=A0A6A6LGG3_HEVBR|nr:hypothetical protein GH714_030646 [Hevea brasiliensis]
MHDHTIRFSGITRDYQLSPPSISEEAESFLLNAINMNFFERLNLAWKIIFPSPARRKSSNARIAKQRLKMILFSDRCAVSDEAKRKIVKNVVHALSEFVEIDSQDKVQLNVTTDFDLGTVYSVTVPVRRVRAEYQDAEKIGSITNIEYKDTGETSGSVDVRFDFFIPDERTRLDLNIKTHHFPPFNSSAVHFFTGKRRRSHRTNVLYQQVRGEIVDSILVPQLNVDFQMNGVELPFENPIGDAVSRIRFAPLSNNLLISSWDSNLRLYDVDGSLLRLEAPSQAGLLDCCYQSESMAFSAGSDGGIRRYDLHSGTNETIGSHHDIATCVGYSDQTGYAVGYVDGRVALEFLDPSNLNEGYTFRCHPKFKDGRAHLVSINDIVFNPLVCGTFVSGDNDGYIITWNNESKRRLYEFPRYPNSVASLSFNQGGELLAIASSYTYQEANENARIS